MSSEAREIARDIYRHWGLPPSRGAFVALVLSFEGRGRLLSVSRRELAGADGALERADDGARWVIYVASDLRGTRRLLTIGHELAHAWLCERHDCVETDCDAVARELVTPTWVPGVQLSLAFGP